MKIESIIKRSGGTVVDMDAPTRQYHFKPEDGLPHESPHVAIVTEDTHARMLLRIREGFRLVEGEHTDDGGGSADGFLPKGQKLIGSNIHNASYQIHGGETIELDDLVVMAYQDSGLSFDEWQDLPDQTRYEYIDATLAELVAGEGDPDALDNPPAPVVTDSNQPAAPAAPIEPPATGDGQTPEELEEIQRKLDEQREREAAEAAAAEKKKTETTDEVPLVERPRKELVALYKARFGREPSTRMAIPDIANALSEDDD